MSNLAAIKLWDFFGIAVDGGIVVFPLTYIIGDLIVEFYGKETAKNVVWAGFLVNIIAIPFDKLIKKLGGKHVKSKLKKSKTR